MSANKIHRLGDLQLQIMTVLWQKEEATVTEVHQGLAGKNLAYTTVATMLRKMENRGLVKHRQEGGTFVYRAAVGAETVSTGMATHLLDRLFAGSVAEMVHHLLTTREVSREELVQLEKLIGQK